METLNKFCGCKNCFRGEIVHGIRITVRCDTLEDLQKQMKKIDHDIKTIKEMNISDDAKVLPLFELELQRKEIKTEMHKMIERM